MLFWAETLLLDLQHAARGLGRSPGFTAVIIGTLAIGIGASTAVFSLVDLILFRALPFSHADRLVSLGFSGPIDTNEFNIASSYLDWREQQTAFQALTSMYPGTGCDLAGDPPVRIDCYQIEADFLRTLGVAPILGRDLRGVDDRPGAPRVGLLGFGLWQSRFGGDPSALGKFLSIDGGLVRIIGVLPASFEMPQGGHADVLLPEQMDERAARAPNATVLLRTFGRLKDGIDIPAARQRILPLFQESVRKDVPPSLRKDVGLVVRSLRDRQIHDVRAGSWLLFGAVLALLALACANVTNLWLARAAARQAELAVRAALGAGRGRLLRQMLAETSLLSLSGCALGCAFATLLLRLFRALAPEGILRLNQARIDGRVLLFALASALVSALLAAILPAWERLRVQALMGWRVAGAIRTRSRQVLVAVQIALSLVLLAGSSLLLRSLWNLEAEPLGFHSERVVTASFTLNRQHYRTPAQLDAFCAELEQQLARIPGIAQFALSDTIPPAGGVRGRPFSNIRIAGHPPLPEGGGMVAFRYVTPGYFRALGIPIVAGRDFEERERAAASPPIILSATLARRMFGSENPVGQQIDLDLQGHWLPIVGVAADVKNSGLAETPEPEYYRLRTYNSPQLGLSAVALLRTSLDEATAARWIRQQIAAIDRDVPVNIETMWQRVGNLSRRQRFLAALLGLFAGFGLLLAAIGLYGVLSFLVTRRTREIGIRIAVGATPGRIARMLQQQAALWTVSGVAAGLAASGALGRIARSVLFHVSPYDPLSLASAVAILVVVSAAAAWWPARRASRVDPAISLRQE
jgi:putative ABC transport system permease protein